MVYLKRINEEENSPDQIDGCKDRRNYSTPHESSGKQIYITKARLKIAKMAMSNVNSGLGMPADESSNMSRGR